MTTVVGADLSLNHGAVVRLRDGVLDGVWYYTDIAGAAGKSPCGARWKAPATKDKHIIQMERLAFFVDWFRVVVQSSSPEFMGIEDYALDSGRNAQHTGEVGGAARIIAWEGRVKLRLHDPMSVKMFGAHNGHADKAMMERAVASRWGVTFGEYNPSLSAKDKEKGKRANRQTSEDLCDAFVIAQMVWAEVQLRNGDAKLSDFHEQEIRVFNRLTKFMPMNLLDREWIDNPWRETKKPLRAKQKAKQKAVAPIASLDSVLQIGNRRGEAVCVNDGCLSTNTSQTRTGSGRVYEKCHDCGWERNFKEKDA